MRLSTAAKRRYSLLTTFGPLGLLLAGALLVQASPGAPPKPAPPTPAVSFDRDVRPILSENCFACHGFDANKRQAGLRLDTPEGAHVKAASGKTAVVPGDLNKSELVQRVAAHDWSQMPPASSGKKITPAQVAILKQWVKQGGEYAKHWAFAAPKRPALPNVANKAWVRNSVDRFILARLEKEGLAPSPEADKRTLLRRVTLDLTGLPPTPAERDAFLSDKCPDAYERLVDRLLASPHYGERMALAWLDLARYADTHGYHIDSQRDMWRWRDWVIAAFNRNLPYDQFTIEQIAGDLLPNATLDQKIATGFNRNHPINFEGGAIPEEYAAQYVHDRVDTTSTVFLGLTTRCAQCHDHKYDPITQKDYYKLFAFFNNVPEQGLDGQKGNAAPFLKAPLPDQQKTLDTYQKKVAEYDAALKTRAGEVTDAADAWAATAGANFGKSPAVTSGLVAHYGLDEPQTAAHIHDATVTQPVGVFAGKVVRVSDGKFGGALQFDGTNSVDLGDALAFDRTDRFSYGAWVKPVGNEAMTVLSRLDEGGGFRGWDLYLDGGKAFVHLIHEWDKNAVRVNTKTTVCQPNEWTHLFVTYDGSGKAAGVHVYVNGKPADLDVTHDNLTGTIKTEKTAALARRMPGGAPFKGVLDEVRAYDRELSAAEVAELAAYETLRPVLVVAPEARTDAQKATLRAYYLEHQDAPYQKLAAEAADWRKKRDALDAAIPTTMVMEEMAKPRETHLLVRGQYDHPGELVMVGTPAVLPPLPATVGPANRLTLARWLVSPSNPLTSRVAVNRYWQMLFGTGLVKTAENFGTQGEWPTHPELLDWLATEFVRQGWDTKRMLRLLVTSATYRQTSRATPEMLRRDPENRLFARAPRIRLPAETVRDQALAAAGLLVPAIGGPSVKPYQPAGLWEEIAFGGGFSAQTYEQDHGDKLYRRSMYTFWKRTVPPPGLQTFDAPEREFCLVRRGVTNTPLQALVLMNDPTYVEAARKLAERILKEPKAASTPPDRLRFAFRLLLDRSPTEAENKVLLSVLDQQRTIFRNEPKAAAQLLSVGESKRDEKLDPAELAAWASVASVLLNLDETITKG